MFGGGGSIIYTIFAIYMVYMVYMVYVVSVHCGEDGCIGLNIPEDQKISRGPGGGMYWKIHPPRPKGFPEGETRGTS